MSLVVEAHCIDEDRGLLDILLGFDDLIEKLWGAKPHIYTSGIQATHVQRTTGNAVPTGSILGKGL